MPNAKLINAENYPSFSPQGDAIKMKFSASVSQGHIITLTLPQFHMTLVNVRLRSISMLFTAFEDITGLRDYYYLLVKL